MAEAPKCRNFPSCGKRHYGDCGVAQEPRQRKSKPKANAAKKRPKPMQPGVSIAELLARIESLEARVTELEARKKYMREYQRARRAEGRDD